MSKRDQTPIEQVSSRQELIITTLKPTALQGDPLNMSKFSAQASILNHLGNWSLCGLLEDCTHLELASAAAPAELLVASDDLESQSEEKYRMACCAKVSHIADLPLPEDDPTLIAAIGKRRSVIVDLGTKELQVYFMSYLAPESIYLHSVLLQHGKEDPAFCFSFEQGLRQALKSHPYPKGVCFDGETWKAVNHRVSDESVTVQALLLTLSLWKDCIILPQGWQKQ